MFERSWLKILPYGLLALITVLAVYDPTLDSQQLKNIKVSQVADISIEGLSLIHI